MISKHDEHSCPVFYKTKGVRCGIFSTHLRTKYGKIIKLKALKKYFQIE